MMCLVNHINKEANVSKNQSQKQTTNIAYQSPIRSIAQVFFAFNDVIID